MKRSKRIKNASNQNHNSNQEEYSSSCTNGSQSIASTIRKRKNTTPCDDLRDIQSSHQSITSNTSCIKEH